MGLVGQKTGDMGVVTTKLEDVVGGLRELAGAYQQGYREQRRMLRISDRLQLDLHQANQTLGSQAQELKQLDAGTIWESKSSEP